MSAEELWYFNDEEECYYDIDPLDDMRRWKSCGDGYWVSDTGDVLGPKGGYLATWPNQYGHQYVCVTQGGVREKKSVHRLVGEAFLGAKPGDVVRHLDDIPTHNELENLAVGTAKDNVRDCIKHGRFRYFTKDDIEKANEVRRKPVDAIDIKTGERKHYKSIRDAGRDLGCGESTVSSAYRGNIKSTNGYYICKPDEKVDISNMRFYKPKKHRLMARNEKTGEVIFANGQTEMAKKLGISISSISMYLSGKTKNQNGYVFEYV